MNKILGLLDRKDKINGFLLLIALFIVSVVDVLGIASIMPFIAVVSGSDVIKNNEIIVLARSFLGEPTESDFIKYVGVLCFTLVMSSLILKALTHYFQMRFVYFMQHKVSVKLTTAYLGRPYVWHLQQNSADLTKTTVSEIEFAINIGLMSLITIFSHGLGSGLILLLLIIVDPAIALATFLFFLVFYGLVYAFVTDFVKAAGIKRSEANKDLFLALGESFGAVKEIKLRGSEMNFIRKYSESASGYARSLVVINSVAVIPRFLLEGISFGGMILLVLYMLERYDGFSQSISIIALYAFAGYRLLPSLQKIFAASTQLNGARASVEIVVKELLKEGASIENGLANSQWSTSPSIELKDISFTYPRGSKPVLDGVNLLVPKGAVVAFVGESGSGKSTLVDIILGLLEPQSGSVFFDGSKSEPNAALGGSNVGYVPQHIYLCDDTLAANIAFAVPAEVVDPLNLKRAAKLANIDDFIENDLELGYETIVGERGARLSGGQRQRIGIARALYSHPKLLIMDEATSALDNLTENSVMASVESLRSTLTVIIIAHRLSTVKRADLIFFFDKGRVLDSGTFDELFRKNKMFRDLASVGSLQ